MLRKIAGIVALFVVAATAASAQVNVRGQLLYPDGDVPVTHIRFYLTSDDGRVNEYRYTDSTGRFILERLSGLVSYTITVEGDEQNFDRTTYSFVPSYESTPRVTLRPLSRRVVTSGPTVTAASAYKPQPQAAEWHKAALKEIEKQQFAEAEILLRKAAEKDPKFAGALTDLGALLMRTSRYTEAEPFLRKALTADPKFTHALLNLGATLNHLKRFAEAVTPLRDALRSEPGLVSGHLHLGVALVEIERFEEAEKHLLRATKEPGEEEIPGQLYLGKLYGRTGKFEAGIAALETYLQKAPNAANADEVRGLISRMKKELSARM